MSTTDRGQWADALEVANATKRQNQRIKAELKALPRPDAYLRAADIIAELDDRDPAPSLTLEALFGAIPRVAKTGSKRLCIRLGIAPNKKLRDLTPRQALQVCALMHAEAQAARNGKSTVALKRAA
jgi:hypothetical protein